MLGITSSAPLTPDQLVSAVLTAPVDLLWNGGIGTYVKAEPESNAEVGDRAQRRRPGQWRPAALPDGR